jgi:hypothetical protein
MESSDAGFRSTHKRAWPSESFKAVSDKTSLCSETDGLRVVGGLAHVDMIVRVHWLFAPQLTTKNFNGTIRDDLDKIAPSLITFKTRARREAYLIDIHVGLSARAGLPYDKRKVIVQLSFNDLGGLIH